jgi:hypothetical protein
MLATTGVFAILEESNSRGTSSSRIGQRPLYVERDHEYPAQRA